MPAYDQLWHRFGLSIVASLLTAHYFINNLYPIMKKIVFLFCLLLTAFQYESVAQSVNQEVKDRSYSYGAMLSQGIGAAGLNADEKNIDKLIEGIQVGLQGDSATFAASQQIFRTRMQSRVASTNPEEGAVIAYNIGISIIGGLAMEIDIPATDFDFSEFKKGFQDADTGKETRMEKPMMDSILNVYFQPITTRYNKIMEEKKMAQSAGEITAGKEFLENNAKRKEVVTLPSGLQYVVIKEGSGKKPTIADKVKTHYHGTLIDGTIFDSSVDRGQPATFGVGQVIKGWQEGIPLMTPGSKYTFYIPQDLAYGMRSPSPKIPAGATLIFEVELLEVIAETPNNQISPASESEQAGAKFLQENEVKEGVISTPSGLQYKVLVQGDGPKPSINDKVKTHYHGTLIDGTVFDSSVDRGQPATFPVNGVIKGWQEAIPLMPLGSKYRLFIPQNLAYGMRAQRNIPAGSTLIFEVELLEINPE